MISVHVLPALDSLVTDRALLGQASVPQDAALLLVELTTWVAAVENAGKYRSAQDRGAPLPLLSAVSTFLDRREVLHVFAVDRRHVLHPAGSLAHLINTVPELGQQ